MKHCKSCGKINENILLKYCQKCYPKYGKQLNRSKINIVSDKKKERIKNGGSEMEIFRDILIKRQDNGHLTCEMCGNRFLIDKAGPTSFAHILAKGQFPHLRLFPNNIKIVCNDISMNSCHTKMDSLFIGNRKEIEQKILNGEEINLNEYKIG